MGDASGNLWRAYVTSGRKLNYEMVPTSPAYYWRNGSLYTGNALKTDVNPYAVVPGVVRDAEYPLTRAESGGYFLDARDLWIEEISVDADGRLSMKSDRYSEPPIHEGRGGGRVHPGRGSGGRGLGNAGTGGGRV